MSELELAIMERDKALEAARMYADNAKAAEDLMLELNEKLKKAEAEKELVRANLRAECEGVRELLGEARKFTQELRGVRGDILRRVLRERERQVEKWTVEGDDAHVNGELVLGAVAYALRTLEGNLAAQHEALKCWPFDAPMKHYAVREFGLVVAMAMLMAEMERLQRAAVHHGGTEGTEGEGDGEEDLTTEDTESTEGGEKEEDEIMEEVAVNVAGVDEPVSAPEERGESKKEFGKAIQLPLLGWGLENGHGVEFLLVENEPFAGSVLRKLPTNLDWELYRIATEEDKKKFPEWGVRNYESPRA